MAIIQHTTVGYITLESAKEELLDRTFSNYGNIDSNTLATGRFFAHDFKTLSDVGEKVYGSKMYIYEVANARLEQVVSAARQMVRRYGCEVLFIDYLQLIRSAGDRREQVERSSMAMKELARQLEVPVIVAAQLRRDADGRRPGLGDFQHSSQMEQDADAAMLIYEDAEQDCVWLHVAKNRDGEKGSVKLRFKGSYVRFEEDVNG
jgi:replicative DNA helicase